MEAVGKVGDEAVRGIAATKLCLSGVCPTEQESWAACVSLLNSFGRAPSTRRLKGLSSLYLP
jgi:hypothetical protein